MKQYGLLWIICLCYMNVINQQYQDILRIFLKRVNLNHIQLLQILEQLNLMVKIKKEIILLILSKKIKKRQSHKNLSLSLRNPFALANQILVCVQ